MDEHDKPRHRPGSVDSTVEEATHGLAERGGRAMFARCWRVPNSLPAGSVYPYPWGCR